MSEIPRCRHCGEVIGVYEPLVRLRDGHVDRELSGALTRCLTGTPSSTTARCFERLGETQPLAAELALPTGLRSFSVALGGFLRLAPRRRER